MAQEGDNLEVQVTAHGLLVEFHFRPKTGRQSVTVSQVNGYSLFKTVAIQPYDLRYVPPPHHRSRPEEVHARQLMSPSPLPRSDTRAEEVRLAVETPEGWPTEHTESAWLAWLKQASRSTIHEEASGVKVLVPLPEEYFQARRKRRAHELAGGWHFGADLNKIKHEGADLRRGVVRPEDTAALYELALRRQHSMARVHGRQTRKKGLKQTTFITDENEYKSMPRAVKREYELAQGQEADLLKSVEAQVQEAFGIPKERKFSSLSLGVYNSASEPQLLHGDNAGPPTLAVLLMCSPEGGLQTEFVDGGIGTQAKYEKYWQVRKRKWEVASAGTEESVKMLPCPWMSQGDAASFDSTSPHRGSPVLPSPDDPLVQPKERVILYMGLQWKGGELAESDPVFAHKTQLASKASRYAFSQGVYQMECRKKRKL